MKNKVESVFACCGLICPLVMFGGLLLAGFFPPTPPSYSAVQVQQLYNGNTIEISFGVILLLLSAGLYIAFTAAISSKMSCSKHSSAKVLSFAQLGAGVAIGPLIVISALSWGAAALRVRSDDITLLLNDIGWMFFVIPVFTGVLQNLCLGLLILIDRDFKIFPRWLGYFNLWVAVLFIPGCIALFFEAGPFAWNGLFAFWLPASVFGPWFFAVGYYLMVSRA